LGFPSQACGVSLDASLVQQLSIPPLRGAPSSSLDLLLPTWPNFFNFLTSCVPPPVGQNLFFYVRALSLSAWLRTISRFPALLGTASGCLAFFRKSVSFLKPLRTFSTPMLFHTGGIFFFFFAELGRFFSKRLFPDIGPILLSDRPGFSHGNSFICDTWHCSSELP